MSRGGSHPHEQITRFWAGFFGVTTSDLSGSGLRVVPHVGLGSYSGIWAFSLGDRIVVSSPLRLLQRIRRALEGCYPELQAVTAALSNALSDQIRLVGPAFHGTATVESFVPAATVDVAEISREQALQIDHNEDDSAWDDSGLGESGIAGRFGMMYGSSIVAASGCRYLDDAVASIGFYTVRRYRRRGAGTAVLSAAISHLLRKGHGIEFQTLDSNVGAIRSATRVGITRFATHVAIVPLSNADPLASHTE